ncbi:hypothetical protein ABIE18_000139 [Arthrobacter sp. 2762]
MKKVVLDDCEVLLDGGRFLHLAWNKGVRIEADNARAAMEAVNKLAEGQTYPLLVDMTSTGFLSHEARKVFAQPCAASKIALLGAGPVDRILVEYQLRTGPLSCPTRFFISKAEASAWLLQSGND